jgi:hypothetical protein
MTKLDSAKSSLKSLSLSPKSGGKAITHYLPFLDWLIHYRREDLVGDLLAGSIVAIMLVPQGMAYAMLAGLPPQIGLYASIVPLVIYGLLGSSRVLAVGPVAIVSLLVASGVAPLAEPGSAEYVQLALTLALLVAIIQFVMGLVRLGFLVNFLSHPVVAGFTSAAAIVIGFSQLKHLIGVNIPRTEYFYEQVLYAAEHIFESNVYALIIGLGGIAVLLYFQFGLGKHLRKTGLSESVIVPVSKAGPLVVVLLGTVLVVAFNLFDWAGVKIVGDVPAGLPPATLPVFDFDLWQLGTYCPGRRQFRCYLYQRLSRNRRIQPLVGELCRRRQHRPGLDHYRRADRVDGYFSDGTVFLPAQGDAGRHYHGCRVRTDRYKNVQTRLEIQQGRRRLDDNYVFDGAGRGRGNRHSGGRCRRADDVRLAHEPTPHGGGGPHWRHRNLSQRGAARGRNLAANGRYPGG